MSISGSAATVDLGAYLDAFTIFDGTNAQNIQGNDTLTFAAGTGLSVLVGPTDAVTFSSDLGNSIESSEITDGTILNADLANSSLTITGGNGLTGGGVVSLGGTIALDIGAGAGVNVNANDIGLDVLTIGTTTTTASNSGLEVSADGLRLLGGCSDGQYLRWNAPASQWECASDTTFLIGFNTVQYINNTAVPTDVPGLSFTIGANEDWYFRMHLHTNGDTQDDSRWNIICPVGAVGSWSVASIENSSADANQGCGAESPNISLPNGSEPIIVEGLIRNGSTAGTVQLQARENVNTDLINSLQIFPNSTFQAWQVP